MLVRQGFYPNKILYLVVRLSPVFSQAFSATPFFHISGGSGSRNAFEHLQVVFPGKFFKICLLSEILNPFYIAKTPALFANQFFQTPSDHFQHELDEYRTNTRPIRLS